MGAFIHRLLTLLNEDDPQSTNYHIAMTFILHYQELRHLSIGKIADICHVSKSTISKFTRSIGFDDFFALKDSMLRDETNEAYALNYPSNILTALANEGIDAYFEAIIQDIKGFQQNIDYVAIDELAKDLLQYQKVAAFGVLFSESAAVDLQYKLAYQQKFILTFQNDLKQNQYIEQADEQTLIIIFSNSGNYLLHNQLDRHYQKNVFKKTKAKVALITANPQMKEHPAVDLCLLFNHQTPIQTHGIMYQMIVDVLIHRYQYFQAQAKKESLKN